MIEIVVVGGVGFLLHNMIDRSTADIDYINDIDQGIIDFICQTFDVDMNNRVANNSFKKIFLGWESNVVILKEYSNLKVFSLNKEFLCSTKFFTKESDMDLSSFAYRKNSILSKEN